jgi:hypothetical protein
MAILTSDSSIPLRLDFFQGRSSSVTSFPSTLLRFYAGEMSATTLERLADA